MLVVTQLPASPPLELFERLAALPHRILLEGAPDHPDLGRYSYLMADPVATLTAQAAEWPRARDAIRATIRPDRTLREELPPFQGGWAGWFGYELGAAFDKMPRAVQDDLQLPDVAMGLYDRVIAWDHLQNSVWLISSGVDGSGHFDAQRAGARSVALLAALATHHTPEQQFAASPRHTGRVAVDAFAEAPKQLTADFTADGYRNAVAEVIEYILDGDLFQANLTQRFVAPFAGSPVSLYRELRQRTAAPMSALLHQNQLWIASASPERFLKLDAADRLVETRPIKGTRPRGATPGADTLQRQTLAASVKDRAENVMIVDLLRNDLSRVCIPGSVQVPALCTVESFPTVHHLVSTVTGTLAADSDALDLIAATFPGGSITGAPKLRAMEILSVLEPVTRGVYTGAIGWIGLDGSMDTSIAIRTITCKDGVAVLNAGGGVTARSAPEEEYQESLDKARALVAAVAAAQ